MYSSTTIRDPLSDPKIAALMATISSTDATESSGNPTELKLPPDTFEDFLKDEYIDEWPQRLTSEGKLDLSDIDLKNWQKDNLLGIIKDSVSLDVEIFSNIENTMNDYEGKLNAFCDHIVSNEELPSRFKENMFHAPKQEFLDKIASSDGIMLHHSNRIKAVDPKQSIAEEMQALRSQNIDYASFPGFRDGELTELPSQLETPQLLNKVSQAQDFSKGFNIFWKKIFLSEAMTALLQDTFWWFYLEHFENDTTAQDKLFTRIAATYVTFFMSIHNDFSDKFFRVFPRCFAQCVYLTFREAYPESKERLSEHFLTDIYTTISEWMTGVKPPVDDWKIWPWGRLCSPPHDVETAASRRDSIKSQGRRAAEYIRDLQSQLDAAVPPPNDDSTAVCEPTTDNTPLPPINVDKKTLGAVESKRGPKMGKESTHVSLKSARLSTAADSSVMQPNLGFLAAESAQTGPGPDFERVMFNLAGRSPLVSQYLYMRQLKGDAITGQRMRRTEISQYPSQAPTFQEVIQSSKKVVNDLHARRERMMTITEEERLRQEKHRKQLATETNKMLSDLGDPIEIKLKSDRVMDVALGGGLHRPSSYATARPDTSDVDLLLQEDPNNLPDPNSVI